MHMPFGKHKGQNLETIPRDYLMWVRGNLEIGPYLAECIDAVFLNEPLPPRPKDHRKRSPWGRNRR